MVVSPRDLDFRLTQVIGRNVLVVLFDPQCGPQFKIVDTNQRQVIPLVTLVLAEVIAGGVPTRFRLPPVCG